MYNELSRRTATTRYQVSQKAARNRLCKGAANIRSGAGEPIPRKHSPDGAAWHASGNQAYYSFIDPGGMKG